jgi:hypothetical protein
MNASLAPEIWRSHRPFYLSCETGMSVQNAPSVISGHANSNAVRQSTSRERRLPSGYRVTGLQTLDRLHNFA